MRGLVLACLLVLAAPLAAAERIVRISDVAIEPADVVVDEWESVVWVWPEGERHGVFADADGEEWCPIAPQGCVWHFRDPGEFRYHCPVHPEIRGRVLVERRAGDPGGPLRATFLVRTRGFIQEFDASPVAASRVAVESYDWDFGDNTTASGRLVEHAYARPGSYLVRLIVVDEFGNEARGQRRVEIHGDDDPAAHFRADASGRAVRFTPVPAEGRHAWDFGDGDGGSTVKNGEGDVLHVYLRGGVFVVNHTVTTEDGVPRSAVAPVVVSGDATFRAERTGLVATFDASGLPHYGNASYSWLFGDLERAEGAVVAHAFPQAGRWSVELTLTDDVGAQRIESELPVLDDAPVEPAMESRGAPPEAPSRATPVPVGLVLLAIVLASRRSPESYK